MKLEPLSSPLPISKHSPLLTELTVLSIWNFVWQSNLKSVCLNSNWRKSLDWGLNLWHSDQQTLAFTDWANSSLYKKLRSAVLFDVCVVNSNWKKRVDWGLNRRPSGHRHSPLLTELTVLSTGNFVRQSYLMFVLWIIIGKKSGLRLEPLTFRSTDTRLNWLS